MIHYYDTTILACIWLSSVFTFHPPRTIFHFISVVEVTVSMLVFCNVLSFFLWTVGRFGWRLLSKLIWIKMFHCKPNFICYNTANRTTTTETKTTTTETTTATRLFSNQIDVSRNREPEHNNINDCVYEETSF